MNKRQMIHAQRVMKHMNANPMFLPPPKIEYANYSVRKNSVLKMCLFFLIGLFAYVFRFLYRLIAASAKVAFPF